MYIALAERGDEHSVVFLDESRRPSRRLLRSLVQPGLLLRERRAKLDGFAINVMTPGQRVTFRVTYGA